MLSRKTHARLAARRSPSTRTLTSPREHLRRAVAEVLEDRRLLTVVPTFAAGVTYLAGNQPRSIVSVDVNNDGLLDFVTADSVSGTVTVRRGPPVAGDLV